MTIIWYLLFFWTLQHRRDLIVDDMQHKKQQKVFVWKNKDMLQRLIIFWRCMLHSTRFICDNMTSFLKTNDNFRTYLHFYLDLAFGPKNAFAKKLLRLYHCIVSLLLLKFFWENSSVGTVFQGFSGSVTTVQKRKHSFILLLHGAARIGIGG